MTWQFHVLPCRGGMLTVHERPPLLPAASGALPLVLLHGFTGSGRDWKEVAEYLPAHRILAPDLPGHGLTQVRPGLSFEASSRVVVDSLGILGVECFHLGGYSMGGRLALQVALEHPHRVARLVLESASPGIATEAERQQRRAADEELATFAIQNGIEAFVDRWERTPVLAAERRLPDAVRIALRQRRLRAQPEGLAASLRDMGTGAQPWLGERLGALAMPTLLIAGGDDAKFRAIATDMQHGIGDARCRIADGAGHNVHLERPQWFAEVVGDFISL